MRKALWVSAGVVAVCLVWGIWEEVRHAGRVWPGVWVGGQPAGGLTPEELRARLQALAERRARQPVTVRAGRLRWAVTAGQLGLRVEGEEAVQAAYRVGRGRELGRRLRERWDLLRGPVSVQVRTSVDGPRLAAFLDEVSKAVHAPPREGRLVVRSGRVEVVPHRDGVRLDRAEAERLLRAALLASTREVELPLKPLRPVWTTERLQALGISRQVASFSTYFPPDPDRAHNIALAASRLRGLLLPTGSELSFNEAVGPRTARAGYREAPVLLDDELVPGDGGGVCQVSTTLFNAALLAGLAVRSRTNHSQRDSGSKWLSTAPLALAARCGCWCRRCRSCPLLRGWWSGVTHGWPRVSYTWWRPDPASAPPRCGRCGRPGSWSAGRWWRGPGTVPSPAR